VADLPTVMADRDRLHHLFETLFRSAVEHGAADATTCVDGLDGGGFFVADDGPGILPEEREDILATGYSTEPDVPGWDWQLCAASRRPKAGRSR